MEVTGDAGHSFPVRIRPLWPCSGARRHSRSLGRIRRTPPSPPSREQSHRGRQLSSSARRGRSIPTPPRDTSTATHAATGRSPAGLIPTHPQRETQHARTQYDEHRAANTTPSQHHVRHVEPSPLAPRRASRVERRPGRRPRVRCDVVRLLRAARPVRPLDDAQIASDGALAHVHALGYLRVGQPLLA